MAYQLGVDLGTTYTAAAVCREGRAEVATLGTRSDAIPSVAILREDGMILVGEAAARRALTEPHRAAREFKRRLGDPVPIVVGATPLSAELLMAKLLESAVHTVTEREGGHPSAITITHPANWGAYKQELLGQAVRMAGLADGAELTLLTEPEAAAIAHAATERVEPGQVIAVYDLGGGTFDAAVLRKSGSRGFEILGTPEGIERLGGIDFDEAVFQHVVGALGTLPTDDEAAVARLRAECVAAKEALSADTDATIPVLLPAVQTNIRLTRGEFEEMIRPTLLPTVDALRRAVASAGVEPADLAAVLLVGGSSRIPLVAQLVTAELGRPPSVEAHPKDPIALGAALHAGRRAAPAVAPPAAPAAAPPAAPAAEPVRPPVVVDPPERPQVHTAFPGRQTSPGRRVRVVAAVAGLALLLLGGLALARSRTHDGVAAQSETVILLEPAAEVGPHPFVTDAPVLTAAITDVALPREGAPTASLLGVPGDAPGLYASTTDPLACDKARLVAAFDDPAKQAAWAAAAGLDPAQLAAFVEAGTPVVLRSDTLVTNHGFRDAGDAPRQAVLQSGTAVLVDDRGQPRVRCLSGTPLTDPLTILGPTRFEGPAWASFNAAYAVVVTPAAGPINGLTLANLDGGGALERPAGTNGERDAATGTSLPVSLHDIAEPLPQRPPLEPAPPAGQPAPDGGPPPADGPPPATTTAAVP